MNCRRMACAGVHLAEDGFRETLIQDFDDLPKDKVERVELYRFQETEPYKTLQGSDMDRWIA